MQTAAEELPAKPRLCPWYTGEPAAAPLPPLLLFAPPAAD